MLAQMVSPVGTVCSSMEDPSKMDPMRGIEKLSSSLQTCKPFAVSDVNPTKSSIANDSSTSEILSCTLNSISLVEISEERDDEENDQKNMLKKAGKGCRKQLVINQILDSILSSVERKTRSYKFRPARSSVWGSIGILKYFENNASKVIKNGSKNSKKAKTAFGRIRFKVKQGKETSQTCLKDMISVESTCTETCKIPNFSGHNLKEEVLEPSIPQCCNGNLEKVVMPSESLDICSNKDLESSVTGEKLEGFVANNHQDIERSGVSVNKKYLDLGTSPDSEVIYPIPESQINGKERDDFHDRGSIFPCMEKNKGRKHLKISMPKQGSEIGSGVFESPENKNENASRMKGDAVKSIGNKNVKDKTACGKFARTIKDYHETGYDSSNVIEIDKTRDGNVAQEKIDAGIAHIDVPDQCTLPHNAWVCCDECFKWRRISAILADSINETNSRWTCKENVDKDFADCSIPQEKSNSEINAELDISDVEEDAFHGGLSPKRSLPNQVEGQKQSSWRLIKSNMFMHRCRKSQSIDEMMVCHCKLPTNGKFGCGDGCLNRMLNIECVKGTCPCEKRCSNQQFQKRKYAKLKWFRCGKKGYGLQLLEDISEGQFLIEYVGEVLDMEAYEARQKEYASKGHKHFYFMTLNGGEVIDACAKGNLGRFINHSCDPNCRTEKWMVNGEVSVGFFALKDLKKGDEVTFDYNYVRVFGAAAKKCVCGSSQCRGYIGGDPRDSNVIVKGDSDDEFPEPVMVYDNGEVDDSLKKLISSTNPLDDAKASFDNAKQALIYEDKLERAETVNDKTDDSANDVHYLEKICRDSGTKKLQISFEVMGKSTKGNILSPEASALTVVKKISAKKSGDTKKKHKSDKLGDTNALKSKLMKTSRLTASVKKGKSSNSYFVRLNKSEKIANKSHGLSDKPKKVIEASSSVEETLNELLDDMGGISKRQDATKGYLKLLLLTAASGDSGNGEAIQSNRELSMILGAILKTQSRSVLVDVINKNGLQMLHNMLKRCRKDFSRIPILRKLLRVLEFLATKEIITKDLINKDPSCMGVESFRESILSLAEHDDKQVHQIARNFRKNWIPWSLRRKPPSHNHWQNSQTRDTVNNHHQTIHTTVSISIDTVMKESCSTQSRKRKSRWDQPADSNKEPKLQSNVDHINPISKKEHLETNANDDVANMDEDMPPGFAPPRNKVERGYPRNKFMNRLALSYGIPMPIVHQLGYPETENLKDWCIAPGIPFQPYPPLPVYSRNKSDMRNHRCNYTPAMSQTGREIQGTNNPSNFQQGTGGSLGIRRYFKQQKFNSSRLPPPWKRKQNGRGFLGNDFRNRMCGGGNGNNMEIDSHYFTPNPHNGTYY